MVKRYLTFILSFNLLIVYCQVNSSLSSFSEIPILNTDNYKKGIYKDFNEFLNNKPSDTSDFSIKGNYLQNFDSLSKKYIIYNQNHWGFCDNNNNIYFRYDYKYLKMRLKGLYSLFSFTGEYYGFTNFGGEYNRKEIDYVINLLTNDISILNVKNMTKILEKEDKDLLNDFLKEPVPKSQTFRYLKMLNEKLKEKYSKTQ